MDTATLIRWAIAGVLILISLLLYRVNLRIFFGVVIVPEDRIGLVT